ncbi:MAG: LytTR family DNA-binding domain-containing protein [Bacteroidales bacterium]
MKVLIIEDEQKTAERLKNMILEIEKKAEVVAILDSIEASVRWLKSNPHPNLIFQDIHLADGSGFEIYKTIQVDVPVIFTTAFDQYAIEAFKVNSIDYLLKPINKTQLSQSLEKFNRLKKSEEFKTFDYTALAGLLNLQKFQHRFMVRYGQKIKVIETENIAYFYTISGNNFFKTFENDEYPSDFSLDKLEEMLDPDIFYRINRQFIINIKAIGEMYAYSKSRVKIELNPPCEIETIASTERSGDFKKWLAGNMN